MPLQSWKDYAEAAESAGSTTTPGPLPDGKYNFRVFESEYREFPSGSQGISTNCVIEDGPYEGRRVYKTFFIVGTSSASLNILFRQFAAMGVTKEYIYALPDDMGAANAMLASELIGRRFLGTVVRDDRKPEYPSIKYIDPPLSGPTKVAATGPAATPAYPAAPGAPAYPSVPTTAPVAPAAAPTAAQAAPVPPAAPVAPAAPWVPQAAPSVPTAPAVVDDPWGSTPPPAPVY